MEVSEMTGSIPFEGETEFFKAIGRFIGDDKEKPADEILEKMSFPALPDDAESVFASKKGELFTITANPNSGKALLMFQYILSHPDERFYIFSGDPLISDAKHFADRISEMLFETTVTEDPEKIRKYSRYIISSLPVYICNTDYEKYADKILEGLKQIRNGYIFIYDFIHIFLSLKDLNSKRAKFNVSVLEEISENVPVTVLSVDYDYPGWNLNNPYGVSQLKEYSDKITDYYITEHHNFPYAKEKLSVSDAYFHIVKSVFDDEGAVYHLWRRAYGNRALIPRKQIQKVFIGGSQTIDILDEKAKRKIDKYISDGTEILIGDCRGVDKLVQAYLFLKSYQNVSIYATDGNARHNIGLWEEINVPSHGETGYDYYRLKDAKMIEDADEGFMIWDGKSRGTGFNIQELQRMEKRVFVHMNGAEEKHCNNGVFWLIDDKIYAFPYDEKKYREAVSKSGSTYNHKKIWEYIRPKDCRESFDYYPRGRVVITRGNIPVIYMSPHIDEKHVNDIIELFNLQKEPIIKYDNSEHYKCHLDS